MTDAKPVHGLPEEGGENGLVFQSSNGGFFLSTPLSEALTEVALDGVEHEEAFMVCDMMCRISMPWIPCVEGVDVVPVRLIFG